jgi:hypothetical protein
MANPKNPWLTFCMLPAVLGGLNWTVGETGVAASAASEFAGLDEMIPRKRRKCVKSSFISGRLKL